MQLLHKKKEDCVFYHTIEMLFLQHSDNHQREKYDFYVSTLLRVDVFHTVLHIE